MTDKQQTDSQPPKEGTPAENTIIYPVDVSYPTLDTRPSPQEGIGTLRTCSAATLHRPKAALWESLLLCRSQAETLLSADARRNAEYSCFARRPTMVQHEKERFTTRYNYEDVLPYEKGLVAAACL